MQTVQLGQHLDVLPERELMVRVERGQQVLFPEGDGFGVQHLRSQLQFELHRLHLRAVEARTGLDLTRLFSAFGH